MRARVVRLAVAAFCAAVLIDAVARLVFGLHGWGTAVVEGLVQMPLVLWMVGRAHGTTWGRLLDTELDRSDGRSNDG